jgi:hypothetical protein
MAKRISPAPEGARITIFVEYQGTTHEYTLQEAAKVGQILTGMTTLLGHDAMTYAEGKAMAVPAKPQRRRQQSYMVPTQVGPSEEPQG